MKTLLVLTLVAAALVPKPGATQDPCKTDKCQERESYKRADATMTIGHWLESIRATKSQPEHLKAFILAGDILFKWEGKSHCKPERANVNQAVAIAEKYFQDNPQIWHLDAPTGIGVALGNSWPCPSANGT